MLRSLGYEKYGLWVTIVSVVSIACLLDPGLAVSTTVFLAKDKSTKNENSFAETLSSSVIVMLLYSLIASVGLYLLSTNISVFFTKFGHADRIVFISSVKLASSLVFFQLAQQFLIGIEQAYQKYKAINILDALQLVFISIGGLIISIYIQDVYKLIQWQTAIACIFLIGHILFVWMIIKPDVKDIKISFKRTMEIVVYGFSNWISILSMGLFTRADRLIVGSLLGSNNLAIYTVLLECSAIITSFTTRAVSPVLPLISSAISSCADSLNIQDYTKQDIHSKHVKKFIKINFFIASGIGMMLLIASPVIISLLLPNQYSYQNVLGLQLISTITALSSISVTGYFVLLGLKKTILMTGIFLFSSILALSLISILTLKLGLLGSILGNMGWILTLSITYLALWEINPKTIRWLTTRLSLFAMACTSLIYIYKLVIFP